MSEPRKVLENRFKLAEHQRNIWFVTAEAGTDIEEIFVRDYWAHVARMLRPYDEILVAIDTNEWLVKLLVHSAGPSWANVVELHRWTDLRPKALAGGEETIHGLYVQWRGPHAKFGVVRKADGQVLKDGFTDRQQAEVYMNNWEGKAA